MSDRFPRRRETGLPIHRYLNRLRFRRALERLAEGAPDLTELALAVGFTSHGHLSEAFRREFSHPPPICASSRPPTCFAK